MPRAPLLLIALVFLLAAAPARSGVIVQSIAVGFKARALGNSFHQGVYRLGSWAPVVVDLQLENQASFDGLLRVAQFDNDGDVCFDEVPVHLLASSGGAQRYFLYILPSGEDSDANLRVDVLDERGEAVTAIYNGVPKRTVRVEDRPTSLEEESLLLVDISVGSGAHAGDLSDAELTGHFHRDVYTARLAAGDLPEHWIGLEAVDFIVWDEADPADFKSEAQLRALVDWVRHGGTLVVAAARTAGSLATTELIDAILPVDIAAVTQVSNLGAIPQRLLGVEGKFRAADEKEKFIPDPLLEPVTVAPCKPRKPAATLSYYSDDDRPDLDALITRHQVGQGYVVFCGVTLHDLFTKVQGLTSNSTDPTRGGLARPGSSVELFKRLLFLRTEIRNDHPGSAALYPHIQAPINFVANTALFLLLSFTFILAYGSVATFFSWWFLNRRGWTRHSWSAFAVIAMAASVLSVMVVQSVRGFGQTVEQLSIVDVSAGAMRGSGMALFGLKTGTHTTLDAWVPSDPLMDREPGASPCFLRPAPRVKITGQESESATTYASPGKYRLIPASAVIEGVPVRATLKKLEGRWEGPIKGTVDGTLTVIADRNARKQAGSLFTPDSIIHNRLDVDLTKCCLLYADRDFLQADGNYWDEISERHDQVYALPLGNVAAGKSFSLGQLAHLGERGSASADDQGNVPDILAKYILHEEQKRWRSPLRGFVDAVSGAESPAGSFDMRLEPFQASLMLASTLGEMERPSQSQWQAPTVLSRDHLRLLDLHGSLRPDTAILIGFARDAGPIRLATRKSGSEGEFHTVTPRKGGSWTMYRVFIPVRRQ